MRLPATTPHWVLMVMVFLFGMPEAAIRCPTCRRNFTIDDCLDDTERVIARMRYHEIWFHKGERIFTRDVTVKEEFALEPELSRL